MKKDGIVACAPAKGQRALVWRKNAVLAHMWWNLAAAKGEEQAIKSLNDIEKLITPGQIAEAQRLAAAWKPKGQ